MARRKRLTALFDVIHRNEGSAAAAGTRWWSPGHARSAVLDEPIVREIGGNDPPPTDGPAATEPAMPIAPKAAAPPALDIHLDRTRRQIMLRVSYRSAAVAACAGMLGILLAYIVGSHMSRGPARAMADPSTDSLRAGPAHPEVLNSVAPPTPDDPIRASGPTTAPSGDAQPAPYSFIDNPRVIGRHYVVVQMYTDRKTAEDAAAMLTTNNVPCTVETGFVGVATANWFCVVGQTGFDKVKGNAAYDHYEKQILQLSTQIPAGAKPRKLDPKAYAWRQ
jgi:hypothetical protein